MNCQGSSTQAMHTYNTNHCQIMLCTYTLTMAQVEGVAPRGAPAPGHTRSLQPQLTQALQSGLGSHSLTDSLTMACRAAGASCRHQNDLAMHVWRTEPSHDKVIYTVLAKVPLTNPSEERTMHCTAVAACGQLLQLHCCWKVFHSPPRSSQPSSQSRCGPESQSCRCWRWSWA
jgi:hypothetical protein